MSSGWISLHRKLLDWEWYDDPNTMRLFIHCLLRANFESTKWRGHDIERGQFITSYATLSSELKLSPKQIRVALDKLKRTGEVASKSSSQHTVITVNNYLKYQDRGTLWGKQGANEGQAEGKRGATDNKNNKNNNENKNKRGFNAPTIEQVKDYCLERKNNIDPEHFIDYYLARGWVLKNGSKIKDWKAAIRTWEKRDEPKETQARSRLKAFE